MGKKKYFFFDIDGTLTDRKTGEIVPSAQAAIEKLREAGHFVAINTGRMHYKARKFFERYGFNNMVCNGGHGIVVDKQLIENEPLPYEKVKKLYDEAVSKGYGVLVTEDDSQKVYSRDFKFYEQCGLRKEPTTYIIDEKYDPAASAIVFKLYISIRQEDESALETAKDIRHIWFEPEYMMVQNDDKKRGIDRMLEIVDANSEDVVVWGDDTNDLDMFAPEYYKIAMGNGHPKLKAVADEVAPANIDDGIYKVCEAHGWFESVRD